jgi:anti-sigma factor RsiW
MGGAEIRDMITCRELVELVSDYVEGRLDRLTLARFEEHLAECPPCVRYIEQLRHTIEALGHLPPEPLAPEVERELIAVFRDWRGARRP